MKRSLHLYLLAATFAPLLAHAAGGAYEINQDCAAVGCFLGDGAGFPISITKAGSYVLTSDLLVTTAGVSAISINASPVDLNLNGHTIDGGGTCTGSPVSSCSAGAGVIGVLASAGGAPALTLHVHDGTIRGFSQSPTASAALSINDAGDGVVVDHVTVLENGGNGAVQFYTTGIGGTVRLRDSQVARNGSYGIARVSGSSSSLTAVIENSEISGNKLYGITGFSTATLSGDRFNSNGGYAINGVGATVAIGNNTFSANNANGLQYNITNVVNLGGSANNVCLDHSPGFACP